MQKNQRKPANAKTRFNWRGNRPRMGKRAMCAACGLLIAGTPHILCPQCGLPDRMVDVSYDD